MTPDEEAEMRAHFQAVLRANRELGPAYEKIAVDQLMQKVRDGGSGGAGGGPARTPPPPGYGPRQTRWRASGGGCGRWSPWAILGIIAGLFWVVPAVLGAAVSLGALVFVVVVALVIAAIVRRVVRRLGPWGGGPWADREWGPYGGSWGPGRRWFGGW